MGSWLIVSVWGDPGGWSKVYYRVPEIHKVKKCKLSDIAMGEQTYSYRCTLGALLEAYRDYVSEAVVYVADTLAFSNHLPRYVGSDSIPRRFESYNDVIDCVKHYVNSILDDKDYINLSDRCKVKHVVLPSVGVYKRGADGLVAEFTGSPLNYYYGLLFDLYTRLRGKSFDTIVLDVSHGVNFMPILGFNAVIEVVKLYALEKLGDVRLVVLNSDPVNPRTQTDMPRNMNIVYCKVYSMEDSLRELVEYLKRPVEDKLFRILEGFEPSGEVLNLGDVHRSILGNVVKYVRVLLESIDKGLPLPLVYTLERLRASIDVDYYLDRLVNSVNTVIRTRRLESKGSEGLRVKHSVVLSTPVELDLKALVLLRVLTSVHEESDSKEFEYNGKPLRMYSLESLEKLVEKYMVGAGKIIALHEVSDIRVRVNAYEILCGKVVNPTLYKYIYEFTEQQVDSKKIIDYYRREREAIKKIKDKILCPRPQPQTWETIPSIDKRIFFAHAGFHRNITLVAVDNAKLYVGHIPDIEYEDLIFKNK